MNKLCCIFNTPSLYRQSIYLHIDKDFDCDWYFEDTDNKLAVFDTAQLKRVKTLHSQMFGPFYWVSGMLSLLFKKEYTHYLMMGHSRNLSTFCFLVLKRLLCPNKKTYLWTHGFYGKESRLEFLWKKLLLASADKLLIYGDYACNLMKQIGFAPDKLYAIHNSLAYDIQLKLRNQLTPSNIYRQHFGNIYPVIIFIGRLNPVKKLPLLIEALSSLKKKGEIYNLVLVGDGSDKENIALSAEKLGVSSQVWFYGACYDELKNAKLIYNADVCVAPGNIGLTAIHVLMFGCPAITHNDFAYQMPEFEVIKPNITGDFFVRDNLASLTDTLHKWFSNNSYHREKIRQACYEVIDREWTPEYQMGVLNEVIRL